MASDEHRPRTSQLFSLLQYKGCKASASELATHERALALANILDGIDCHQTVLCIHARESASAKRKADRRSPVLNATTTLKLTTDALVVFAGLIVRGYCHLLRSLFFSMMDGLMHAARLWIQQRQSKTTPHYIESVKAAARYHYGAFRQQFASVALTLETVTGVLHWKGTLLISVRDWLNNLEGCIGVR